ncbi:glutamine synthetase III family protein [Eubacterium sp. MSJ-33]|uniref:glutamine synthetase III family protein n=1 Tax=Eubacterium sp. MSJ-33 TaxID=2841528 RepID=UPI001C7901FA|nr:glutamine synthetase III [Eubacterium sp. MSJ-33]QWT53242.1 glutamine synthetase III [Eubacterium sp. MSJ-33]
MEVTAEDLGKRSFCEAVMRARLPKAVFKELKKTIDYGAPLDAAIADSVAIAMREWAKELGATHYTHWFHPLTNLTAEKHDSFMDPVGDGTFITEFTGKELIKAEPDGSSFPSGGIRETCAARGYTVWDCTSPAFVKEIPDGCKVLCIPTIFISYTGESLDHKTPLLRSMDAVSKQALRILKLFGKTPAKVTASVGPEQEYFLIDKDKFNQRLDLKLTGRTLFGAPAPKGQELDDQYFGVIKDKVSHFMRELNKDLWEYGIPAKTQHNEVAPSQHEIAPIYGTTNVATDQNQLLMETLKKVAERNGFACLLHEKPFAGVNGSGKHNNWSISTSDGENLIDPGKEPEKNLQFQVFLAAILESVDNHAALLRLSASSAGNDHRLGANEAPPAIISAYLGDQLADVVDQIIANGEATSSLKGKVYKSGCSVIPEFKMDATDRNRTSPFAFTGNKFEFRMVGSTQCIAQPMMTLNTIVADTLCNFADELEKADDFEAAAKKLVADKLREHQRIIFNGNGYSEEWIKEAERRGLPNIKCMVDAVEYLATPENIAMFEKHGVMSKRELVARGVVMYENYAKQINIEALTMIEMSKKQIIPAVMKYEGTLAASVKDLKDLGISADTQMEILSTIDTKLAELKKATAELEDIVAKAKEKEDDPKAWAKYYHDVVFAFFDTVRKPADELEKMVDAKAWPFPTYEELLFEQ